MNISTIPTHLPVVRWKKKQVIIRIYHEVFFCTNKKDNWIYTVGTGNLFPIRSICKAVGVGQVKGYYDNCK